MGKSGMLRGVRSVARRALVATGLLAPVRGLWRRVARREMVRRQKAARELYGRWVRPGDLCFDVGANVGHRTEVLLGLGARVVAVEPHPGCAAELRALFGKRREFTCVEKAIGSAEGHATLHLGADNALSSLRDDWVQNSAGDVQVALTTLDKLVGEFGAPHFCKIDVEGLEAEVFRGLSKPIPLISFEFHPWRSEATLECVALLERLGTPHFNVCEGEAMRLSFSEWLDPAAFREQVRTRLAGLKTYGDVYVRFEGA